MYNWKFKGTLDNCLSSTEKGVYILIFNGSPKRIVYVGTTNNFSRRIEEHRTGYLRGNRTIWRVSLNEDIYELMSYQGNYSKARKFEYYALLAGKRKLWAQTTVESEKPTNHLYKGDNFDIYWKKYVSDFYIKNLEV